MLIEHSDELESDLLMHFGIDLRDFWTGELSLRRLMVLIYRLVRMHGQSDVSEAVLGEPASWGNIEYLLADLRDSIESGNYMFLSAHKSESFRMPEFKPYPRPGLDLSQSVTISESDDWASAEEIADLFRQMHGG